MHAARQGPSYQQLIGDLRNGVVMGSREATSLSVELHERTRMWDQEITKLKARLTKATDESRKQLEQLQR